MVSTTILDDIYSSDFKISNVFFNEFNSVDYLNDLIYSGDFDFYTEF